MDRLSLLFGRLIEALAALGCALLFAMMIIIVGDVLLRNFAISFLPKGLAWSNEVSELMLYLITMCVAPWLLRQGQHIRVDIVLQVIPAKLAWSLEWLGDLLGFLCCFTIMVFSFKASLSSYQSGALSIKTLVTPEWWSLAPLSFVFMLLSVEMIFRMRRLYQGPKGPRHDAVSAS
ncbi:MAG: TRAP transporter small permease [Betaproteobacteria bacterium]|jgi:TRAP-type C4-dicarboxylate transport system permease small subunit